MKPDWNDAPEWANYVAMDAGGEWFWYTRQPVRDDQQWSPNGGQCQLVETSDTNWVDTLEARP